MTRILRTVAGIFLWTAVAAAQVVPGRYIVELNGSPLGVEVRTKGRSGMGIRLSQIRTEQTRVQALIVRNRGRVLSSMDSLMNALIVAIPDEDAAALAALPGVAHVYPVHEAQMHLDHALAIHKVPEAWARIGGKDKAGAGVKIAILDTGISPDHAGFQDPDLKPPAGFPKASSTANLAFTNNKIIVARSYEDIYQETDPDDVRDRNGHGTATAMCAAGVTNTGPFATITGVAPKAWIGAYKIVPGKSGSASGDVILKALDDALADGMDVINISFGSPFQFSDTPDSEAVAFNRLQLFGVIVVVSAGNSGPNANTMGNFASLGSVISVGAEQSDRLFRGSVAVASGSTYMAFQSTGPVPKPITSTVFDVSTVDPTALLCSPLPAGAATGKIALISRGTCTFEVKVNNAAAGGASSVVIANNDTGVFGAITIGAATLPTVLISNTDGAAFKSVIAAQPATSVTVSFDGVGYPGDSRVTASFSSRGPSFDYTIKPDLVAVGTDVYTAVQTLDPTGETYNASGYLPLNGTSFSAPITAGAAAVLKGARPGLTVPQYRSLLINSVSPYGIGGIERVQRAAAGRLNLDNALSSSVSVYPTSLSFFLGDGNLGGTATGDVNLLTITNLSSTTDVLSIKAIPFDNAPVLQFAANSADEKPVNTMSLTLEPGQSKTIYPAWIASRLGAGEYQGDIVVEGKIGTALVPYWYGVPNGIPASIFVLNPPATTARAGATVTVYVRVVDVSGYAITDNTLLGFRGTAAGGGTVTLSPTVFFPNIRQVLLKMGPAAGANTFTLAFGQQAVQIAITGN